ncbi:substrate-binding domain-containing protein [Methylosinus sp. Ce-a6]|uniref:substrate-binding domain-containing protein n=1 Tax=Methylosinus sp. Ce-a6 TaxID=2172005 RepID=UPI0013582ACA|nr:substrate-binding domain-containing protein [Methylosinus sp. Ce-a6]
MSAISFGKRILNGSSALALSSIALLGVQPASADPSEGIFGGGSTLASLALRQEFDCWADHVVKATGPSTAVGGSCFPGVATLGLYAGVGSGNGARAYIANRADHLALGSFPSAINFPAVPPEYKDGSIASPSYLTSYPYPHIDFGASDSPLASNLLSGLTVTTYTVTWGSTTVTAAVAGSASYNSANWGAPIQLPLFEAPVAVAINVPTSGTNGWTINSQTTLGAAGGAIQLSTAQVCAIFSGLVTNWNDTTTNIPYLLSNGSTGTQKFSDDNSGVAYHTNKAITIVYRSDGSGTSFVFTNYLKNVCPLLDPSNTYGYQSIYNTSVLPNNNFTQLINKVTAYGRAFAATVGADGSDAVAAAIGNSSANDGRIGYLSNDFVQPYNPVSSTAPYGASLQNDYLRLHQVYHPGQSGDLGSAQNFIAPTPTSADAAWAALNTTHGVTLSTTWTFNDYNIYAKTFPANTNLPGSPTSGNPGFVDIGGRSILPLADGAAAYSLVGTAYGFFYSCYGDTTSPYAITGSSRESKIKDFLTWFYNVAGTKPSTGILNSRGFGGLPSAWVSNINAEYLNGSNPSVIAHPGAPFTNCYSVTGGAQG